MPFTLAVVILEQATDTGGQWVARADAETGDGLIHGLHKLVFASIRSDAEPLRAVR